MNNHSAAKVIQGNFPGGVPAQLRPQSPQTVQPRAAVSSQRRPQTYQELTAQAHQRSSAARTIQPAAAGNGSAFSLPPHLSNLARRPGQRLPPAVRQKMEAFFGADFSDVQVRVGPEAGSIGALAFTQGSDIYFAPGQYNPATAYGQQLLAHELTHVAQQRAGRVRNPFGAGVAVVHDAALEAEAERMGARAALYRMPAQPKMAPVAAVQRSTPTHVSGPVRVAGDSYRITAVDGHQPVGSVMLHARDRSRIELTDLGVAGAHRGRGYGQVLLKSALRAGLRMGKKRVALSSQDDGTGKLTQWYKSLGFKQVGADGRGYARMEAPISRVLSGTAQRRLASPPAAVQRRAAGGKKCGCGCGGCGKGKGKSSRATQSSLRFHPWHRGGAVQLASPDPRGGKEQVNPGYQREVDFNPDALEPVSTAGPRAAFGGGKKTGSDGKMYAEAIFGDTACLCTQGKSATSMSPQPGSFQFFGGQWNFPYTSENANWQKCVKAPESIADNIKESDKRFMNETLAKEAKLADLAQQKWQTCERKTGKPQSICEQQWEQHWSYLQNLYNPSQSSGSSSQKK